MAVTLRRGDYVIASPSGEAVDVVDVFEDRDRLAAELATKDVENGELRGKIEQFEDLKRFLELDSKVAEVHAALDSKNLGEAAEKMDTLLTQTRSYVASVKADSEDKAAAFRRMGSAVEALSSADGNQSGLLLELMGLVKECLRLLMEVKAGAAIRSTPVVNPNAALEREVLEKLRAKLQ